MCTTSSNSQQNIVDSREVTAAKSALPLSPSQIDLQPKAPNKALLRTLRTAGVEFLRYTTVDSSNNIRAKVVPIKKVNPENINNVVSIAEVCFGGLPYHADAMVEGCTVDARRVLRVQPDFDSLRILPYAQKTAMVFGTLHEPKTQSLSPLCTRGLLHRVIDAARQEHGIEFSVGAELEFSLMRNGVPVDNSVFANVDSLNEQEGFISKVYKQLEEQDIPIELIHSESASGQLELVLEYQNNPMDLADNVVLARETIRNVAKSEDMQAVFLPKINTMQAGNGLHLHFSFRETSVGRNAFPGTDGMMSQAAQSFVEGILSHLPALLGVTIPSANSFRRVGKGCWTGHSVSWNTEDKESPVRVCLDLGTAEATNVELKLSDSTANIYLELAVVLSAGLHGIAQQKKLRPSSDDVPAADCPPLPETLSDALNALEQNEFLADVMGKKLLLNYLALRRAESSRQLTLEEEVADALSRS